MESPRSFDHPPFGGEFINGVKPRDKKDSWTKRTLVPSWKFDASDYVVEENLSWMMDLIGFDIWNFSTNLESVHLERRC